MAIRSNIKKTFTIPKAPTMTPDSVQKDTLFNGLKEKKGWNNAAKQMSDKVVVKKGNRLDIIFDG